MAPATLLFYSFHDYILDSLQPADPLFLFSTTFLLGLAGIAIDLVRFQEDSSAWHASIE